jgi:hypothetical protein
MKFVLLIHDPEEGLEKVSEAELQQMMGEYRHFTERIKASGQYVGGARLQKTTTATSVRVRDGKRLVTDGPFAETKEQLGGYYVVDVANLDEAIALAERIPSARWGTIEVRPLFETPTVAPV